MNIGGTFYARNAKDIPIDLTGTLLVAKDVEEAIRQLYSMSSDRPFAAPLTNPALNAITVAMIDDNGGVVITLTAAGNSQTLPTPTDTTKQTKFMVVNNDTSTHPITIIGSASVVLQAGEKMIWLWDGTAWIGLKDDTLWLDNGTTYEMKVARDLDLQNKGLRDDEVATPVLLGDALNTSFDTTNKSIIGALNEHFGLTPKYRGVWNATTNIPALVASTGNVGDFYVVSVKGTTSLDGIAVWDIGDWVIFYAGVWQRLDHLKLFGDDGTDVKLLTSRNIDLQTSGLKDADTTTAVKLGDAINTTFFTINKTILGAVNEVLAWIISFFTDTKEPTGIVEPKTFTSSYDNVSRKITIGGTTRAVWRNEEVADIVAGEIDLALPAGITTTYYLIWKKGTGFEWSTTFDTTNIYIVSAVSDGTDVIFCLRENHGLLQHQAHLTAHFGIGTLRLSGGDITDLVLNSTTATDKRPSISDVDLLDEDLPSTVLGVVSGGYTRFGLDGAAETMVFDFSQTEIVELLGQRPYYNQFTGGAWQKTLLANNQKMNIWAYALPTTDDAFSRKYKLLLRQGQIASTDIGVIQAETPASVNLGLIGTESPEFFAIQRFIVQYNSAGGGTWQIVQSDRIAGSKANQVVISGVSGLTAVSVNTDNLQGNGTITSPLSMVEVSNTFGIETKTLDTFLKADGKMVIYEYILDDGTNFRHGVISASWDGTNIGFSQEFTDSVGVIAVDTIVLSLDIDTDDVRLRVVSSVAGFSITAYRRIK